MGLSTSVSSLIDFLGAAQGFVFGVILIFQHRKQQRETAFLGLFIIAYSMNLVQDALLGTNLIDEYPDIDFLPLDFGWLHFPLFFVYVQSISVFLSSRKSFGYLVPGAVHLVIQLVIFLLPNEARYQAYQSVWLHGLTVAGYLYGLVIGGMTVRWINRHVKEVENQYVSTDRKKLGWAKWFVIVGIVYVLGMSIGNLIFEFSAPFFIVASLINVALLYWISLRGIMQLNVKPITDNPIGNEKAGPEDPTFSKRLTVVFENIEQSLQKNGRFMESELTIADVARDVEEHPRLVSQCINKLTGSNFNTYVNALRISKARELLMDPIYHNLSIEGIGAEVGFSSKSSFYEAFKRETGTTPSRFKVRA